jgi:hypothetical protein
MTVLYDIEDVSLSRIMLEGILARIFKSNKIHLFAGALLRTPSVHTINDLQDKAEEAGSRSHFRYSSEASIIHYLDDDTEWLVTCKDGSLLIETFSGRKSNE